MTMDERYAEMSHGLFPRFLSCALVFALLQFLLYLLVTALIPIRTPTPGSVTVEPRFEAINGISYLFPLAFFGLFYLISSVRVNLGSDYARVAASIFIGALTGALIEASFGAIWSQVQSSSGLLDVLIQSAGSAVFTSLELTFVGFTAVLLSYKRRM